MSSRFPIVSGGVCYVMPGWVRHARTAGVNALRKYEICQSKSYNLLSSLSFQSKLFLQDLCFVGRGLFSVNIWFGERCISLMTFLITCP
jgi:hypothetical protein